MKDDFDINKLRKKPMKKSVNGKRKGANYQNQLAKKLNKRFKTKEFSSTPGSGAYATTHNLPDYLKIYGDLITPQNFKYCIEAKRGYNKESLDSILNKGSQFWEFVHQAKRDGDAAKKEFLLVIKQDRRPELAVLKYFNYCLDYINKEDIVHLRLGDEALILVTLDDLLSCPDSVFLS